MRASNSSLRKGLVVVSVETQRYHFCLDDGIAAGNKNERPHASEPRDFRTSKPVGNVRPSTTMSYSWKLPRSMPSRRHPKLTRMLQNSRSARCVDHGAVVFNLEYGHCPEGLTGQASMAVALRKISPVETGDSIPIKQTDPPRPQECRAQTKTPGISTILEESVRRGQNR